MSNGEGCDCGAYGECECGCGADWTDQRVYDLQDEVKELKATIVELQEALHFANIKYNK
jgi:hypothetical protein